MADPSAYEVAYSFGGFQAGAPSTPLPATRVDTELAAIEASIATLVDAVKDVRRSDGTLKNSIVTIDSMSPGVIVALSNLDEEAAGAVDDAIALVQESVDAQIDALDAAKADLVHMHTAAQVSVAAISGLSGVDLQTVLAELRALGPQTGDYKLTLNPTAPSGWVPCNDGTIGDATSGGTTRADADTWPLYNILWTVVSDTYAPVNTGRGSSAAADFAAHKAISLTKMLGRAIAIAGSGASLTARPIGMTVGAETVTLDITMIPSHPHTITDPGHTHLLSFNTLSNAGGSGGLQSSAGASGGGQQTALSATTGITTTTAAGGGLPHPNLGPRTHLYAHIKL